MKKLSISFLISLAILCAGCKQVKRAALGKGQLKKPVTAALEKVASPELAEAILLPKPPSISVKNDPFRPLLEEGIPLFSSSELTPSDEGDIRIIGIMKTDHKAVVLLESQGKTGLFHEGEAIGKYTVKKIEPQRLTLESDNQETILEIGRKK